MDDVSQINRKKLLCLLFIYGRLTPTLISSVKVKEPLKSKIKDVHKK